MRLAPCGVCDQSGEVCSAWGRLARCACCEGSGQRLAPTLADETAPCPRCKGAQEVGDRLCAFCDGEGVVLAGPIAAMSEMMRAAIKRGMSALVAESEGP